MTDKFDNGLSKPTHFARATASIAEQGQALGIRCNEDCIAVLPLELEEITKSGLVISKAEDPNRDSKMGTVIAIGTGKLKDDGTRRPMFCKVGDMVIINQMLYVYPLGIQGPRVLMSKDDSVMAVVEVAEPSE